MLQPSDRRVDEVEPATESHSGSVFINKRNALIKESIETPIESVEGAWLVIGGSLAHQRVA